MEVLSANVAMLSNYEVYDFLTKVQETGKSDKHDHSGSQELATITYETKEYLSSTPCISQSPEIISMFLKSLEKYNLTKAEKLQLLNLRPLQPVEIQLIIEEIEERFTEEEITELLELINQYLPDPNNSDITSESMEP